MKLINTSLSVQDFSSSSWRFALKLETLVSIWYRCVGIIFLISVLPHVFLLNSLMFPVLLANNLSLSGLDIRVVIEIKGVYPIITRM